MMQLIQFFTIRSWYYLFTHLSVSVNQ